MTSICIKFCHPSHNMDMNKQLSYLKNFITFHVPKDEKTYQFPEDGPVTPPQPTPTPPISNKVEENLTFMKSAFSVPQNSDIKIREFRTGQANSFVIFVEGIVDRDLLNTHILAPLMLLPNYQVTQEIIFDRLIVNNQVDKRDNIKQVLSDINMGNCAVFVDGIDTVFTCDVKKWDKRGIEKPVSESVIYGPHEGFNENFKINTALIRKTIRSENLICETLMLGKQSQTPCAFMYMKNITNENLVEEMRRRLNNIDSDYIYQAGELEQYLEDSTFSLVPQLLTTERPDKASSSLIEGKIVLIIQGSPFALIAPVTFSEFLTTVEDKYVRFPFANLMHFIRLIGVLCSFLLPGLYISIINFHQEMIPTDLLFAIEATREAVPFPALIELLLMEIAFDIIREASIRVPSPVGSTLGIIGALIIGQAAVSANLVSPIAIIIVAITGIGSFATPNYALNFTFRFSRYIYIILGAFAGFFGISLGLFLNASLLCMVNSLGVPLFTSMSNDKNDNLISLLFTNPIWKREFRHDFVNAKQNRMQADISRKWADK